jgi:IS30 family transposase
MINLNASPEYKEQEVAVFPASQDEALQPRQDRLGGPAEVAELAPVNVRAQSHAMKHRPLGMAERIELEASMRAGDTQLAVAKRLNRATGTISGELARNGGRENYRAAAADQASVARRGAARRGRCAIDEHPPLRDEVQAQLRRGWSPEQIAGILKRSYPHLPLMQTSYESIYRYVYVVARGELKRELPQTSPVATSSAAKSDTVPWRK